jgi:hypothetical protein
MSRVLLRKIARGKYSKGRSGFIAQWFSSLQFRIGAILASRAGSNCELNRGELAALV